MATKPATPATQTVPATRGRPKVVAKIPITEAGLRTAERQAQALLAERTELLAQAEQHRTAMVAALAALDELVPKHAQALAPKLRMPYAQAHVLLQHYLPRAPQVGGQRFAPVQVAEIRAALAAGASGGALARQYGVSAMTISRIHTGKTYTRAE